MAFKFSTGIRTKQCFDSALKTLLDSTVLRLYDGPVPVSPDAALSGSNNLLCEITAGGEPLTFEPGGSTPLISKNLSEVWQGDVVQAGQATFFRLVKESDTGMQSDTAVRVQGTVGGPGDDLTISNPVLVQGAPQRIEYFAISLLEQA